MAELRKNLTKLKVVELKEKLQELGKTPRGLKADLVNQLAEAYEEQSKGLADTTGQRSAPLQGYPTSSPMNEAMMSSEGPESQHYQHYPQPVGQYPMPAQQDYEQPPNYIQPPYEQQYQYPTHQVFSPTHEQQFSQSPAPFQITSQLSPRIASQMSPQLSPQMASQLAPPIQTQITQQLSPQMAAQQYHRPPDFQSPHRGFQSNDSEAYHTEYGGQTAPEQISHYGIPHMDIHAMPPTQPVMPVPQQMVHRTPVIESYASEIPQTQALPPNMAPNMSAFKPENTAFIPNHPSMVPTDAPTDMIDFDDVSIGMDPTNEVQFNQPIGAYVTDQNQNAFGMAPNQQFPTDVNDGQAFSQTNQLQDLSAEDTNDDTNGATNEESTDVDSEDTSQSFSNDAIKNDVKPIESNFAEQQIVNVNTISNTETPPQLENKPEIQSVITTAADNSPPDLKKFDENSMDSVETEDSIEEKNENIDNNDIESNDLVKSESNEDIDSQETHDSKDDQEFEVQEYPTNNTTVEQTEPPLLSQPIQTSEPMEESPEPEIQPQREPTPEPIPEQNDPILEAEELPKEKTLETTIELVKEEEQEENHLPSKEQTPLPSELNLSEEKSEEVKQEFEPTLVSTIQKLSPTVTPSPPIEYQKSNKFMSNEPQNDVSFKQNGVSSDSKDSLKKLNKNQKKKLRKKLRANRRQTEQQIIEPKPGPKDDDRMEIDEEDDEEEIEIEYIPEAIQKDPIYFQFLRVFDKFRTGETDKSFEEEDVYVDPVKKMMERKKPVDMELKDDEEKKDGEQKVSKRKLKQMTRMTVSELKQRVSHPELVEMHDVTAKDPLLLLHLKATRNSVPVPRHWCYKRKYLQGKRGFEKPPFKLPEFIRKTGIMEMRQALQEKEESKSLKAQMREKIRPKMGKIDIDYQKLHDAFFKWQTKPKMTIHGDLYYEGKEFETRLKEKKPGELSNELRTSLGMPTGPNANKCPPPWLIAMQRYGPPPSYPNIKIPGLNAPIPEGCSFGYHAGGWGKPPVDEYGRPLYGDVFGTASTGDLNVIEEEVDRTLWGEMESESEEEEESSEEEEETETAATAGKQPAKEVDESGFVTPAEGLATPSGLASVPTGMETPDMIELRKRKQIEAEMESGDNPALYTVIPEKKGDKIGREMMGSAHTYDMSAATLRKGQGIDVALDPSDLEAGSLDSASVAARYEQTMKEQSSHLAKEDLSDMVAEHAARQKRKNKQDTSKSSKKYQFKF